MQDKKSIIIFSAEGDTLDNIALAAGEFGEVSVSDGSGARDLLTEKHFDMVFVNTPLEKEFGLDLAAFALKQGCGTIIAASAKNCGGIAKKIGDKNIFILPRPLNKAFLMQALRFVALSKGVRDELEARNAALETKLKDVRLVDRAKCVLVEYLRISEADAHRQIQKRAMDTRLPQVEVARDILKTYEM